MPSAAVVATPAVTLDQILLALTGGAGAGAGAVPVGTAKPSVSIVSGSQVAGVVAAALAAQVCTEVTVQNDHDSASDLYVGGAASQDFRIPPGASESFPVANVSAVFVKTLAATATARWVARS